MPGTIVLSEILRVDAEEARAKGYILMFGLGVPETLVWLIPVFIVGLLIVSLFMLAWRLWRLSSDLAAIRDAVEYIADRLEVLWRKQVK